MAAQPFGQRWSENSILINKRPATTDGLDYSDDTDDSNEAWNTSDRHSQEAAPIIDWNRDKVKERKLSETTISTKSSKHRHSNWVAGFVNRQDDKADKAKLDALKITMPNSVARKGNDHA